MDIYVHYFTIIKIYSWMNVKRQLLIARSEEAALKVKTVLSICQMLQERNCVGLCPILYAADLIQFLYVVYCVNITYGSAFCPHYE